MKLRIGFVSNSSSSSFVAVVKPIEFENIEKAKHKVFIECDDGDYGVFSELPEEIYNYLKKQQPNIVDELAFYEVAIITHDGDTILLKELKNIPKDFEIRGGTCSIHGTGELEDFKRYVLRIKEDNNEN